MLEKYLSFVFSIPGKQRKTSTKSIKICRQRKFIAWENLLSRKIIACEYFITVSTRLVKIHYCFQLKNTFTMGLRRTKKFIAWEYFLSEEIYCWELVCQVNLYNRKTCSLKFTMTLAKKSPSSCRKFYYNVSKNKSIKKTDYWINFTTPLQRIIFSKESSPFLLQGELSCRHK